MSVSIPNHEVAFTVTVLPVEASWIFEPCVFNQGIVAASAVAGAKGTPRDAVSTTAARTARTRRSIGKTPVESGRTAAMEHPLLRVRDTPPLARVRSARGAHLGCGLELRQCPPMRR